ncbi:terminase large subunit [Paracoccus sp. p3-h83]|uniref:terminase large subunit n=1 Tax=Paracoccus sp. p3-h83 TaxID=3342805 RepID=UPI0035B92875
MIRGQEWSTALPDWERRIMAGESLIPDLPLVRAAAEKALRIFKRLRAPDIPGNPTYGEISAPWVFDFVGAVFGCYDPVARARMISEFGLLVPKKNGKSSIAAGIMVTAAILNDRPNAELLLIAPRIAVANIAFSHAAGIIRLDEELSAIFHIQEHRRQITHRTTGAVLVIQPADPKVVTGSKAAYVLIDELHEFAQMPRADAVLLEITGGLAARPEGFLLWITTQSKKPPQGLFKATLEKARAVRDGTLDLPILPVLYEMPLAVARDGGWKNPATWPLVNPSLGRGVTAQFLADQLATAEATGPEALALFASQHFNVQVGQALEHDMWPGALFWEACAEPGGLTLDQLIARSEICTVGVDGGGLDDLFALAVIGRDRETQDWLHWCHAWAQPEVLERRKGIVAQLHDFEREGSLTICALPREDVEAAADVVARLLDAGLLPDGAPGIGLDSYGIAELLDALQARGVVEEQMVSIGQGWKLQPAVLSLPRRLKERRFCHGGTGLMAWAVGNAKAELKGSNWVVSKQTAGASKIDPLMATFNAAWLMLRNPAGGGISDFLAAPVMVV